MADIHLIIDEKTLERLRPEAPTNHIPEDVVRVTQSLAALIQTIAILATGAWVVYLYITFQGPSNADALEISSAQVTQAVLSREQAELELRKAKIEVGRLIQTPLAITHELHITFIGPARSG